MADLTTTPGIAAALAQSSPIDSCTAYDDGSTWCHFCDGAALAPNENDPIVHRDDCLWAAARRLYGLPT